MSYLILMSSCIAATAHAWLTRHANPALLGSCSYVSAVVATLPGHALLDEQLSSAQLLRMIVVLGGVALASWPGKDAPARGTPEEPMQ